jgi:YVTN family beta-propeller protein
MKWASLSAIVDGRFVYVTNIRDDSVSVIDALSQTVVRTIRVGKGPNGIAVLSSAP